MNDELVNLINDRCHSRFVGRQFRPRTRDRRSDKTGRRGPTGGNVTPELCIQKAWLCWCS